MLLRASAAHLISTSGYLNDRVGYNRAVLESTASFSLLERRSFLSSSSPRIWTNTRVIERVDDPIRTRSIRSFGTRSSARDFTRIGDRRIRASSGSAIGAEKRDRDKYGPGRVAARSPKLFVAAPPSLLASRSVSVAWRTSGPPPSPPSSQSRSFDLLVSSRNEGRRQAGQRRDRARRRADGERRQRVLRPAARLI